jgi:hypothetical protein
MARRDATAPVYDWWGMGHSWGSDRRVCAAEALGAPITLAQLHDLASDASDAKSKCVAALPAAASPPPPPTLPGTVATRLTFVVSMPMSKQEFLAREYLYLKSLASVAQVSAAPRPPSSVCAHVLEGRACVRMCWRESQRARCLARHARPSRLAASRTLPPHHHHHALFALDARC